MKQVTRIVVIIGCIFVNACTSPFHAPQQSAFNSNSKNAVVVIGTASQTVPKPEFARLGIIPSIWTTWVRVDRKLFGKSAQPHAKIPDGKPGAPIFFTFRHHCVEITGPNPTGCEEDYRITQYSVHVVQPGTYMLESLGFPGRGYGDLVYTSFEESLLYDQTPKTNIQRGDVPWFKVDHGEIIYVGDLIFDVEKHPWRYVDVKSAPSKATAALANYPNINGNMIVRQMHKPKSK